AAVQGSREKIEQTSMSHALNDLKKSLIEAALLKYNGNVTKAAESLGMTRDSLKHHIKKTR
ncbi:MAG: Bacterial regulatory protein Fis family, partial [Thermodesulfobacteriota bacterium]|nr:Bacterial regulatory protein Fis family [Thermodesulfobacteriota bacterium]